MKTINSYPPRRTRLASRSFRHYIVGLIALTWLSCSSAYLNAQPAKRFVELQIWAPANLVVGSQQQWMERLHNVGADRVVIKGGTVQPRPGIEEFTQGQTITVVVTGVMSDRQLSLPGGQFSASQMEGLKAYIQKLRDDGAQVALADKKAFGLTSEQLVALHEDLSAVVEGPTNQQTIREFVLHTARRIRTPLTWSPAAQAAVADDEPLAVDLKGLSAGTAIAYAVRSAGLVLVPRREQGREVELKLVTVDEAAEHWPVGWPLEPPLNQHAPVLFERMDFEVRAFVLADVLKAVQRRMQLPFLIDQNSLAEKNIDLTQVKITYSRQQAPYLLALDAILSQTKPSLKAEPRMDENGTVFLWIY